LQKNPYLHVEKSSGMIASAAIRLFKFGKVLAKRVDESALIILFFCKKIFVTEDDCRENWALAEMLIKKNINPSPQILFQKNISLLLSVNLQFINQKIGNVFKPAITTKAPSKIITPADTIDEVAPGSNGTS
jgi:hypothetical protein